MNYQQALDYIHSINWTFCKPGLERISELCKMLGDPQKELRFIHVAGTNGKGSFCAMLSSVLCAAGYKTGMFTSPYIKVFNERMQINGNMISDDELAKITEYVRPFADKMADKPTEFELITAVGFEYFRRNKCDIVVLEAGMGGRLDSTNIIDTPVLSVITGIALDHTQFLGDTVEAIAKEKAGIIKSGVPLLYGGDDESAAEVIKAECLKKGSSFIRPERDSIRIKKMSLDGTAFDYPEYPDTFISLLGEYQPQNAANVLTAISILKKSGFNICRRSVAEGLSKVYWPARFEVLQRDPLIIFDGAHNAQGISAAVKSIKIYFNDAPVIVLTGVLKDKDYSFIARTLATVAKKAFVLTPDNPRALKGEEYAALLFSSGVEATAYPDIKSAYAAAKEEATRSGMPLICLGSLYTYASL